MNIYHITQLLWVSFGDIAYYITGIILVFSLLVVTTSKLKENFNL